MFRSIAHNPYISLMITAWKYAKQERGRYLVIYSMFAASNIINAGTPIIWGWLVNELQQKGTDVLRVTWLYVGAYLILHFSDWGFHGFARIKEQTLAFNLSQNFLQELYHKALRLPVKWHQDNHSGSTINRVRKAYEALKEFFQDGHMYIHAFAKFVFSFAAMLYFSPLFGSIAILLGVIALYIIFVFDKPYIRYQKETNEKEHVVSATLFDSLSNIITVITLRLEKRMESGLLQKVADIFSFRKNRGQRTQMVCGGQYRRRDLLYHHVGLYLPKLCPGPTFFDRGSGYLDRLCAKIYQCISRHCLAVQSNCEPPYRCTNC
nr:ABC transporter transmembrane domain-containing protein [Haliscomenobacter sp.]